MGVRVSLLFYRRPKDSSPTTAVAGSHLLVRLHRWLFGPSTYVEQIRALSRGLADD